MAEMIATLSDACEREFGFLATRLFRVFKAEETQGIVGELMRRVLAANISQLLLTADLVINLSCANDLKSVSRCLFRKKQEVEEDVLPTILHPIHLRAALPGQRLGLAGHL